MNKIFKTFGGVTVTRQKTAVAIDTALDEIYTHIDTTKGALFASDYEFPGRYSRWDIGFVNPPLEMISQGREFRFNALNDRGQILLKILHAPISECGHVQNVAVTDDCVSGTVLPMPENFTEEERSKQPSIFSVLRSLCDFLNCNDEYFSMFGAFGYDLVFQFEPIKFKHDRSQTGVDCHLFLPDKICAIDHQKETAFTLEYDFAFEDLTTHGIEAPIPHQEFQQRAGDRQIHCDHSEGEFAKKVDIVRDGCKRGDFFEVVLSQNFTVECPDRPSEIFQRLRRQNPSPYEFIINLGDEQLVGASPEIFVRVDGETVETCPISGTAKRGINPMEDAKQIRDLLNSKKDESELTMCTDVDRNDKSRICKPGSVQLIARRLVETYSKLFHTVDHVKGTLLDDCDMFDAFLSHMWACTLTGSPKPIAMQTIEDLENSPRRWYGGCVGLFTFNDQLNTGITIRTIHLKEGTAAVRAGATLLFDSTPADEEIETRVKASAFLNAITMPTESETAPTKPTVAKKQKRVLFVDNQDSFVHTIANYVRQTGVEVITLRNGFDPSEIDKIDPDLIFISPGPRSPKEMNVHQVVDEAIKRNLPLFGVCLGHQGIAEYFGGELDVLETPMHGKDSPITHDGQGIFKGVPSPFTAARYHSLFVKPDTVPDCLKVTAQTSDGTIMALTHKTLPIASVQFHPESILTLHKNIGQRIIANAMEQLM